LVVHRLVKGLGTMMARKQLGLRACGRSRVRAVDRALA
jgi:hypothetical protein